MTVHTRLYLARHCDVENPEHILYGHLPGFGLSEKGRAQAENMALMLSSTPVRKIYVSPLQRAQETAEIVGRRLPEIPIDTTDELIEAKFGLYLQGARPQDVPWRRPLWFVHKAWPGLLPQDEGVRVMAKRTRAPLLRLLRDYPGEGGVCITHGDPIQAFWNSVNGKGRFLRLHCAKGGLLQLDFADATLEDVTYFSPEDIAATVSDFAERVSIVGS